MARAAGRRLMSLERKRKKEGGRAVKPAEYIVLIVGAAVVIVAAVLAARLFKEETTSFSTTAPLYQYYGYQKQEYKGESRISVEEDGALTLENGGETTPLDGTPLYYSNQNRIVLLCDMLYMPSAGAPAYVYCLGEAFLRNEQAYIVNSGGEIAVDGGFLFNGKDLYIFLEPVTLTIGGETAELSPLSYAFVQYDRDAQYFEKDSEQDFFLQTGDGVPVSAAFADGRVIDLNTDMLYGPQGDWQLLINTPSAAKPLM
mgnify:CR=1 FL=1